MRSDWLEMNTSQSQDDLEVEIRVIRLLGELASEDQTQTVTASSISAATDISATTIRRILTQLAIRGILVPKVVLACSECGTESDHDGVATAVTKFCHICATQEIHDPIITFEFGESLKRSSRQTADDPKVTGRRKMSRLLRPRKMVGTQSRPLTIP